MRWLLLLLLITPALARDLNGQYANSPNKQWFESQRNLNGTSCCDVADGRRLEDTDWKGDEKGNYWVRIDGEWKEVPDFAVITPRNRPVDYAVVWIFQGNIMCFMPGAGT